jgi:coenzyme F420-reducing hydrogenase delta subunit
MAEYGEWNRKGATLSDVTAKKEYGVDRDFIVKGIREGKLEYREGSVWGNPYLRILRSQLEKYISEELGRDHLSINKNRAELRKIKSEIANLKKRISKLEDRRIELENQMRK